MGTHAKIFRTCPDHECSRQGVERVHEYQADCRPDPSLLSANRAHSRLERARGDQLRDQDRYGRTVAVCRADGEESGAIVVREGFAWAVVRYSRDYVELEARAK